MSYACTRAEIRLGLDMDVIIAWGRKSGRHWDGYLQPLFEIFPAMTSSNQSHHNRTPPTHCIHQHWTPLPGGWGELNLD